MVRLKVSGSTVQVKEISVVTRAIRPSRSITEEGAQTGELRSITERHLLTPAAPTKPVFGIVKDNETGKPLAGVNIESNRTAEFPVHGFTGIETTTDDQGRYRLIGLPKGHGNHVVVMPAKGQPYLAAGVEVPDTQGIDPVPLDIGLKRGIVIEGRVTDQKSGKPLKAFVEYNAYGDNPHIADAPGFGRSALGSNTTEARRNLSRRRNSRSRTDRRHVYRRRQEILAGVRRSTGYIDNR